MLGVYLAQSPCVFRYGDFAWDDCITGYRKLAFALGAILSSFIFFFSLGYGARVLQPLFAKPLSWKILDILIGVVMWGIAASLLLAN